MVSNFWQLAHFEGDAIKYLPQVPTPASGIVNTNCHVHSAGVMAQVGWFNDKTWGEDSDFFQRVESAFPCVKTGVVSCVNGYIKGGNNLTFANCKKLKELYA
jgi:hypothetical protein